MQAPVNCYDANPYLISLWQELQRGWIPPEVVTEPEYLHIKANQDSYPDHLVAFVGYGCAFGGQFFGTFARSKGRNICRESRDSLLKKLSRGLHQVEFKCCSFFDLDFPNYPAVIYCDPPYENTAQKYGTTERFNSDLFWQKCIELAEQGHTVLVSEYNCPVELLGTGVIEVRQWQTFTSQASNGVRGKRVERLFRVI